MKNIKLGKIWDSLHSSYWFVPTVMAVIAIALAFTMLSLDQAGKLGPLEKFGWIYTGGPEGARTVLSTIAGSMITVAGTAFSITIVALTLASSQFGPRLLRNFMQDTGNQVVLGTFISTFIYCLLVLRTVRGDDYDVFVPQISVTVGMALAIASLGVLIYFIHHASTSIQVSHVIGQVSHDIDQAIDRLFPEKIGSAENRWGVEEIPANFEQDAIPILATSSGYLQAIDEDQLMKIAKSKDLLMRLKYRPGQFIVQGSELMKVLPKPEGKGKIPNFESLQKQLNQILILGKQRTEQQDIEFCINELVEVALRAISPGINDPFTAIQCIDQLSAAFCRLAERKFPSPYRYDDDQNLRVVADPVTFARLTDDAFNQIRQYSKPDVAVRIRMLEALAVIATRTSNRKERGVLLRHVQAIERSSREEVAQECDRQDIEERYLAAIKALEN